MLKYIKWLYYFNIVMEISIYIDNMWNFYLILFYIYLYINEEYYILYVLKIEVF